MRPSAGVLKQPLRIFLGMLAELADRARELDDPELNALMIRLALYDNCLPSDPGFRTRDDYLKKAIRKMA